LQQNLIIGIFRQILQLLQQIRITLVITGMSPGMFNRVISFRGILSCMREMIGIQFNIQMDLQINMPASVMFTRRFLGSVAPVAVQWAIWCSVV
jgi:hypothetical protein